MRNGMTKTIEADAALLRRAVFLDRDGTLTE
jgi:hypothetical protein